MKTQAWGWLVAAALAAGLNASYHDGGLQWAHEVADRVEHSSAAVLALATGQAGRFLTEARLVTARNKTASCPLTASLGRVQTTIARADSGFAQFDRMTARQEAQLARLEANRDRMEALIQTRFNQQIAAQVDAQTARMHVAFNPVVVRVPRITVPQISVPQISIPRISVPQVSVCPRVHVSIPRTPMVHIPAQEIEIESGNGPI
jgi:hypothetical protein